MKKKLRNILAVVVMLAVGMAIVRAAEVSDRVYDTGWNGHVQKHAATHPNPHKKTAKVPEGVHSDTSAPSMEPEDVLGYIPDHQWERYAEWKEDNVYFLRGSTDRPVKKGDIVILRWQTPKEFARRAYLSSRGFSPAEQRVEAARLRSAD